jgi:hypothetical protein
MKWKERLLTEVLHSLQESEDAVSIIEDIQYSSVNVHLAVFSEPFLSLLLSGVKTIESRFSVNKISPFGKVLPRDIILVKESGGQICGLFRAEKVAYFSNLKHEKISDLNNKFGKDITWNIDPDFLNNKKKSKFLTLIWVTDLHRIDEANSGKNDRTSWATIRTTLKGTLFN